VISHLSGSQSGPLKPLWLAMSTVCALYATAAMAQESPPPRDEATEIDRVQVTGSLIKRVEYESTSPVQVITADTNISLGQIETAEFLQKSSIAAGSRQIGHQFGGFVNEGGVGAQTLSLRGLGAARTLVLLDGKRPGPAGTRGQVGAFDLNVLPSSIVQRIELLKDGSSSIYGSDAVAGVANVITRKNIHEPEINFSMRTPAYGGGEVYNLSGATGWNFDNGGITFAVEYWKHEPLKAGDRRYFRCTEDRVWDSAGNRIDRADLSIVGNEPFCNNMWFNVVLADEDYVPSWDGTTIGPLPGYRPVENRRYDDPGNPRAGNTEVLDGPFLRQAYIIQKVERKSAYAAANFSFGTVNWNADVLFNRRESEHRDFRQFFPLLADIPGIYPNDPNFSLGPTSPDNVIQPIYPFRSNSSQRVDYYNFHTGLDGLFAKTWSWSLDASHSVSNGVYRGLGIETAKTGDLSLAGTVDAPAYNPLDPGYLSGEKMDELVELIGIDTRGKTIYEQSIFTAIVTGELFNLPWSHSGAVAGALGAEYRRFRIHDSPPEATWGLSSADDTVGSDHVKEAFIELELPLLRGLPGIESFTINASNRWFDYGSVKDDDSVWKLGFGWQIVPSVRLRATKGTSFRAPGLYEQYLGNQSAFVGQTNADPCIRWGQSANPTLQQNCQATGIPADYTGLPSSSAEIFRRGAILAGVDLQPERSDARTAGLVWTPAFAPISVALDYYEITVRDQIVSLSAANVVGSCYGAEVFPNAFCDLLVRAPGNDPNRPNQIISINSPYINVNRQKVRGYDLLTRYEDNLGIGKLTIESQFTYLKEDIVQLFSSPLAGGSSISDFAGDIARPKLVGNVISSLKRGDLTWTWGMDYVHATKRLTPLTTAFGDHPPYLGLDNSTRDTRADRRLYHHVSVTYEQPKWLLLVGIRNVFDKKPDPISNGIGYDLYGNIPVDATQYDWYGASLFARWNYKF